MYVLVFNVDEMWNFDGIDKMMVNLEKYLDSGFKYMLKVY